MLYFASDCHGHARKIASTAAQDRFFAPPKERHAQHDSAWRWKLSELNSRRQ